MICQDKMFIKTIGGNTKNMINSLIKLCYDEISIKYIYIFFLRTKNKLIIFQGVSLI